MKKTIPLLLLFISFITVTVKAENTNTPVTPSAGSTTVTSAGGSEITQPPKQLSMGPAPIGGSNTVPVPSTHQVRIDPGLQQFILPAMVLLFGVVIVLLLMSKHITNHGWSAENVVRILCITLITTGVLFIISTQDLSVGQNSSTLYAPAFGLLGTMAGYLLGRSSKSDEETKAKDAKEMVLASALNETVKN